MAGLPATTTTTAMDASDLPRSVAIAVLSRTVRSRRWQRLQRRFSEIPTRSPGIAPRAAMIAAMTATTVAPLPTVAAKTGAIVRRWCRPPSPISRGSKCPPTLLQIAIVTSTAHHATASQFKRSPRPHCPRQCRRNPAYRCKGRSPSLTGNQAGTRPCQIRAPLRLFKALHSPRCRRRKPGHAHRPSRWMTSFPVENGTNGNPKTVISVEASLIGVVC